MRVKNENLLEVDNTITVPAMDDSFNLKPVWLGHIANYSIQLVFSGTTIAGSFKLQASNDVGNPTAATESEKYASVTNWTDVDDSSQTVSASGNHMWTVENAGYNWVRVAWTDTGSSADAELTVARTYVKGI